MSITIYVHEMTEKVFGGPINFSFPETDFYINPMHIVSVNPSNNLVLLTSGERLLTNEEGIKEIRRSTQVSYNLTS